MVTQALALVILIFTPLAMIASTASIGLATTAGAFRVNSMTVRGNATLFDGSTVETSKAAIQMSLKNGARLRLATESRATVYQDRLVLEKGGGQLQSSSIPYSVVAGSLRVYAATAGAVARVHRSDGQPVLVAALKGHVQVTNEHGVLVGDMEAGKQLSFDPQADAQGSTKASGCLLLKDNRFIIVDQTSGVQIQLQGAGLKEELGNRVEIIGVADSSQVVTMVQLKRVGVGGCVAIARNVGAAGAGSPAGAAAAGAAAAGGMGTATKALIGGVPVAGSTVGVLAATGTLSGDEDKPTTSR